jgi:hypothetical protein
MKAGAIIETIATARRGLRSLPGRDAQRTGHADKSPFHIT